MRSEVKMKEVVVVMGYPASGKTRLTESFVQKGYARLNRDTQGGAVADLLPKLDVLLQTGKSVVMDNLFPTKDSRKNVIEIAKKNGATVVCNWLDATLEDAQFNAC